MKVFPEKEWRVLFTSIHLDTSFGGLHFFLFRVNLTISQHSSWLLGFALSKIPLFGVDPTFRPSKNLGWFEFFSKNSHSHPTSQGFQSGSWVCVVHGPLECGWSFMFSEKQQGKLDNYSSKFLRMTRSSNLIRMCWTMAKPTPTFPSLQIQLNCLRLLQSSQLTLELSLLVQLDQISVHPPSGNIGFYYHFPLRSPPNINRKFDSNHNNVTSRNHTKVIHVPKIYNWLSRSEEPFASKWRMTSWFRLLSSLLPKPLIPHMSCCMIFPLSRAETLSEFSGLFRPPRIALGVNSNNNTQQFHWARPTPNYNVRLAFAFDDFSPLLPLPLHGNHLPPSIAICALMVSE